MYIKYSINTKKSEIRGSSWGASSHSPCPKHVHPSIQPIKILCQQAPFPSCCCFPCLKWPFPLSLGPAQNSRLSLSNSPWEELIGLPQKLICLIKTIYLSNACLMTTILTSHFCAWRICTRLQIPPNFRKWFTSLYCLTVYIITALNKYQQLSLCNSWI